MAGRRIPAAALVALLAVIVTGWLLWDIAGRRGAEQAGTQALQAARESIPAILSYQSQTAETVLPAAAQDRLTGKFLADYTQLITTVVLPEAKQKSTSATARVPAAGVVSSTRGRAVLLAYVDQRIAVGTEAPIQTSSSVRVTMDKIDGRWLISAFDPI